MFSVAVHVRVIPVQRQHLQDLDVRLSSSGGRTDFSHVAIAFTLLTVERSPRKPSYKFNLSLIKFY